MTPPVGWIYIPNWEKHYAHPQKTRRDPPLPWIKNMTALISRDDYISLSASDRGLLHGIWMLVGVHGNGRVSARVAYLKRQLHVRIVSLDPLIHAGFIEVRDTRAISQSKSREEEILLSNPDPLVPEITDHFDSDFRVGGVARLRDVCGEEATEKSEETWRGIVAKRELTQYDVERVREKALRKPRRERPAYITGTLMKIDKEQAA